MPRDLSSASASATDEREDEDEDEDPGRNPGGACTRWKRYLLRTARGQLESGGVLPQEGEVDLGLLVRRHLPRVDRRLERLLEVAYLARRRDPEDLHDLVP